MRPQWSPVFATGVTRRIRSQLPPDYYERTET